MSFLERLSGHRRLHPRSNNGGTSQSSSNASKPALGAQSPRERKKTVVASTEPFYASGHSVPIPVPTKYLTAPPPAARQRKPSKLVSSLPSAKLPPVLTKVELAFDYDGKHGRGEGRLSYERGGNAEEWKRSLSGEAGGLKAPRKTYSRESSQEEQREPLRRFVVDDAWRRDKVDVSERRDGGDGRERSEERNGTVKVVVSKEIDGAARNGAVNDGVEAGSEEPDAEESNSSEQESKTDAQEPKTAGDQDADKLDAASRLDVWASLAVEAGPTSPPIGKSRRTPSHSSEGGEASSWAHGGETDDETWDQISAESRPYHASEEDKLHGENCRVSTTTASGRDGFSLPSPNQSNSFHAFEAGAALRGNSPHVHRTFPPPPSPSLSLSSSATSIIYTRPSAPQCTHCPAHCPSLNPSPPIPALPTLSAHLKHLTLRVVLTRVSMLVSSEPTRALSTVLYTALPIARQLGWRPLEGRCWYWAGRAEAGRGDWVAAREALEKSLECGVENLEESMRGGREGRDVIAVFEVVRRKERREEVADDIRVREDMVPGLLSPVTGMGISRGEIEEVRERLEDARAEGLYKIGLSKRNSRNTKGEGGEEVVIDEGSEMVMKQLEDLDKMTKIWQRSIGSRG
ncbi:hypothetical protein K432DRAFT_427370 [Lepidopterella palustris CBS 459.81]|uniref:Uncharacterized protein n=1 Tax=Lepidopterella palustris CBS 459.81 TaxID=1314670 RepID=A0A8E2E6H6_9PEZI|nr:hypothetical protein K432DRAFT_427370 [Lepidopterella palustris CBS 459.81]